MEQLRVIIRKLSPDITEDQFRSNNCVNKYISRPDVFLNFYSSEFVGETSAPISSFAIMTFPTKELANDFINEMKHNQFPLSNGTSKVPNIEYAPIQKLLSKASSQSQKNSSIADDPEFQQFEKVFLSKSSIPTDKTMSIEDVKAQYDESIAPGKKPVIHESTENQNDPRPKKQKKEKKSKKNHEKYE